MIYHGTTEADMCLDRLAEMCGNGEPELHRAPTKSRPRCWSSNIDRQGFSEDEELELILMRAGNLSPVKLLQAEEAMHKLRDEHEEAA